MNPRNRVWPQSYHRATSLWIFQCYHWKSCTLGNPKVTWLLCCAQSRLTLCDAVDCGLPGSSVHGILQARILECIACSRDSSLPRDRTCVSCVSCIAGRLFTLSHRGSPSNFTILMFIFAARSLLVYTGDSVTPKRRSLLLVDQPEKHFPSPTLVEGWPRQLGDQRGILTQSEACARHKHTWWPCFAGITNFIAKGPNPWLGLFALF